ncbi:FkbM family methyltransferase [Rhodoferax sp.]|uniref:FkbM family methyltransferase n=1 Tax=Rhodoferax sp. TaxID=50421 RepID=UPI0027322E1B|nr:FkbM family methyltransferase [Rhodoferax sp.]MDP3190362.1 FkbM family methyltransferase [Rhodoferax sp.]
MLIKPEIVLPGSVYLPLRLMVNKLRGRTEADVEFLSKVVRPGSTVVDVGAHKGLYSIPLYKMGCTVYCFEPNAHCASLIESWALGKNRVYVFRAGLSDESGKALLQIPVDETGQKHIASASVCKEFEGEFVTEEITLNRLDEYELKDLSFIKIDVEGLEDKVIRGGIGMIRKFLPAMLIEIEERHRSTPVSVVFDMLYLMGYRAFQRTQSGFQEVLPHDIADWSKLQARGVSKNFWFIHGKADTTLMTHTYAS